MPTSEQEKALLRFVAAIARDVTGWTDYEAITVKAEARAYLATLEPKPEPKRGVEETLSEHIAWLETVNIRKGNWNEHGGHFVPSIEEALRLYREERERVAKTAEALRAAHDSGILPDGDHLTLPAMVFMGELAAELERRG